MLQKRRAEYAGIAVPEGAPRWLQDLKSKAAFMRERRERPARLSFGRWLGDFLDQDTPSGLLPAEEQLLFTAAQGEPCVLQSRAARLWNQFDAWRKRHSMAELADTASEADFAEALTKFLAGAPEAVQEVVHEATMQAVVQIGLPADWEPKDAAETEQLAALQHRYFNELEAEANPAKAVAEARDDKAFYLLAAGIAGHAFAPPPANAIKLQDEWFARLLRIDPLNLPEETRAKIEAQPRVLRGFLCELVQHLKRAPGVDQAWAAKLKDDPGALRPHFGAALDRYEREAWRFANPGDPDIRLRAGFLRFLCLGGDDSAPVHERRLEIHGAYVEEDLDLSGCAIPQPLLFHACHFAGQIQLTEASAKSLGFSSSRVQSIAGEYARICGGVSFNDGFRADAGVSLSHATIEGKLTCAGGAFFAEKGLAADFASVRLTGNANLGDGFIAEGRVSFAGAAIGGDLNCAGGVFRNRSEDGAAIALNCGDAAISGGVALANGFRAEGMVSFPGARIGWLNCTGGAFLNRTGDGTGRALSFQFSQIENGVYLRDGFSAEGEVRFLSSRIKAAFECTGGRFNNPVSLEKGASVTWNNALNLVRATIDGALWLGPRAGDPHAATGFVGSINLAGCHAHEVADHPNSWPHKGTGNATHAYIHLDGFTYDRLIGRDAYDAATRKRWLDRQPPADRGGGFKPQPFEQLIKVYRAMGHDGRAREIAKFKARRQRLAAFINLWRGWAQRPQFWRSIFGRNLFSAALNALSWPFALLARLFARTAWSAVLALEWFLVGLGAAYGYGYFRLAALLFALWLLGGFVYSGAATQGAFAPSNPALYLNKELQASCAGNWTQCAGAPPEMPSFSPFVYSLDVMLPGLDLGQKHDWQPVSRPGGGLQVGLPTFTSKPPDDPEYTLVPQVTLESQPLGEGALGDIVTAQTLLSWVALGLLLAILSGLIKKD